MSTTEKQVLPLQPSLTASLLAGFDAITNHLGLVLFPIALDLYLWLGPHLSLKKLVESVVDQMLSMPTTQAPETAQAIQFSRSLWLLVADRMNLFAALRSFPVGVPSLMASRQPVEAPPGFSLVWSVPSLGSAAGWWLLLTGLGLVAGALYFALVAQASLTGTVDWRATLEQWPWASLQVVFLALFLGGLILAISIPGSCLITVISLTGLPITQIGFLLFGALALWVLFPLLFSAHGIFTYQFKMWVSVRQGVRLTRLTLAKTSLLFLTILIISEGLDTLWRVPAEKSWMTLVGVLGHAFISTSLLAASFIYYRDTTRWVQRLIQQSLLGESKNLRQRIT
jgi:hypothetical protein